MIRDLFGLTRSARELQRNVPTPSMGEMVSQAREAVDSLNARVAAGGETAADGIPGTAIVRDTGTPTRGAAWFNLMLDLEVRPTTRQPYRLANEYLVPASARLEEGTELPVRIDPDDPSKLTIVWDEAPEGPPLGQVRPL